MVSQNQYFMEKIAKIRKIIRISKKKALIFVIIVAIISLVLFKLLSPVPQIPMTYDISQTGSDTSTLNSKENTSAIYPGDYPYQNPTFPYFLASIFVNLITNLIYFLIFASKH